MSGKKLFSIEEIEHLRDFLLSLSEDDSLRVDLLHKLLGANTCRRLSIFQLPTDYVLSVVIPIFNEVETLTKVVY